MFLILLPVLALLISIHAIRMDDRSTAKISRLAMRYILVGYCGIPMLFPVLLSIVHPADGAAMFGFAPGGTFQDFTSWALLGMAIAAVGALFFGGRYLIGPALAWAVFFTGATRVHLDAMHTTDGAPSSHEGVLIIFLTHGLIALILIVTLAGGGFLRQSENP